MDNKGALDWLDHKIEIDILRSSDYVKDVRCLGLCAKALSYRIPKALIEKDNKYRCPRCNADDFYLAYDQIDRYDFCANCGQALDWENERR